MSGVEFIALTVIAFWMGIMTLALMLVIRQVGIIMARTGETGPVFDVHSDGLEIGMSIPTDVLDLIPPSLPGRAYLLMLSASCAPCRELAQTLQQKQVGTLERVIAIVPGREEPANELISLLPPTIRCIRDPEATLVARGLGIRSTPFALAVEDGEVQGKSYLRHISSLLILMGEKMPDEHEGEHEHGMVTYGY